MIGQGYLVNLIEQIIDRKLAESTWLAIGVVTAYDNVKYLAKVQLSYEQVETPFIRIGGPYIGNGFGDKAPLAIGDEVIVAFYNATMESGVVMTRLYTDPSDLPPSTSEGERLLKHSTGSLIRFTAPGGVEVLNKDKAFLKLNADNSAEMANDQGKVRLEANGKAELSNAQGKFVVDEQGRIEASNAQGKVTIDNQGNIEVGNTLIALKLTSAGKASLGGAAAELLAIVEEFITTLNGTSIPPVIPLVTPGVTGVMSPAMVAALTSIRAKLALIKV